MRRRAAPVPTTAHGVPADLAAGPCVEAWADPAAACPLISARTNWIEARAAWAKAHGLSTPSGHLDWHHLPEELRDRAPFHTTQKGTTP